MSLQFKMTSGNISDYLICHEMIENMAVEIEGDALTPDQVDRIFELFRDIQTFSDAFELSDYHYSEARYTIPIYFILCDLSAAYDTEVKHMKRISRNLNELRLGLIPGINEKAREIRISCLTIQLENQRKKIIGKTNELLRFFQDVIVLGQFDDSALEWIQIFQYRFSFSHYGNDQLQINEF